MPLLRITKAALIGAAFFYLALVALLFVYQRKLLFPAPREARTPQLRGLNLLHIPAAGRVPVTAIYLPAHEGAATVVYFHGNGEQLADEAPLAFLLHEQGLGFLGVEYPGYGLDRAAGTTTEAGILAAADSAFAYLRDQLRVPDGLVVVMGHSLGTGVAVQMAARGHGTRMVLLSAYTSIPDAAANHFGFVPVQWMVRDRFESARAAPSITLPVLVVHGTRDETIPHALGKKLSAAFPHGRFLSVEGAAHNDLLDHPDVFATVLAFLRGGHLPAP